MNNKMAQIDEHYMDIVIKLAERTILISKTGKSPIKRVEFNEEHIRNAKETTGRNILADVQDYLWTKGITCYRRDKALFTSKLNEFQTLNWFYYVGKELFRTVALLLVLSVLTEQSKLLWTAFVIIGFLWSGIYRLIPLTVSYYVQSCRGYDIWTRRVKTIFTENDKYKKN